ncbi:hypothetical protein SEA_BRUTONGASTER_144 [Gordonia phage BrutonGaster]|uniref:Uncharacterized protein n=1 Tax=Gordonia phage BrutonGaster TaxID=2530116 RepID=A0A482JHD5_9CAUD|nr:hypothetical protein HOV26_gp038 [Gordonia phage BrutonGaster]QBP33358.1 hypothetical protein SEA_BRUTONGASTER_144 [Gordonia phage BrutonGaster]
MSDNYYPFKVKVEVEVYVQIEDHDVEDMRAKPPYANLDDVTLRELAAAQKARKSVGFTGSYADETTNVEIVTTGMPEGL